MAKKTNSGTLILGIVALIAIFALVLLFRGGVTGAQVVDTEGPDTEGPDTEGPDTEGPGGGCIPVGNLCTVQMGGTEDEETPCCPPATCEATGGEDDEGVCQAPPITCPCFSQEDIDDFKQVLGNPQEFLFNPPGESICELFFGANPGFIQFGVSFTGQGPIDVCLVFFDVPGVPSFLELPVSPEEFNACLELVLNNCEV